MHVPSLEEEDGQMDWMKALKKVYGSEIQPSDDSFLSFDMPGAFLLESTASLEKDLHFNRDSFIWVHVQMVVQASSSDMFALVAARNSSHLRWSVTQALDHRQRNMRLSRNLVVSLWLMSCGFTTSARLGLCETDI
jgi:hypothetical protein